MEFLSHLSVQEQAAIISGIVGLAVALINFGVAVYMGKRNEKVSRENAETATLTALSVGEKNIESLEKRRFIDAISMQRIEWINNLRQAFVSFNELAAKRKLLNESFKRRNSTEIQSINDIVDENTSKLFTVKSNIELYLNPGEFFSDKLSLYLYKMIDAFSNLQTIEDHPLYREYADTIHFIEQVILKAEWKRIKDETDKGEQISKVEMAKIFDNVAKEIDPDMYYKLQEGKSWIKFNELLD